MFRIDGRWVALIAWLLFASAGCGAGRKLPPVNAEKAREALRVVLSSWKEGKSPEQLRAGSPAIIVQDFDWFAGCQLVSYEIAEADYADEGNLHCPVRLRLKRADGTEADKDVTYLITTSPVTTVFREVMM